MTKLALITGGSRGIGAATAELLRAKEWDVEAPGRWRLDFEDQRSISNFELDWMRQHFVPRFDAVIFSHGRWHSQPFQDRGYSTMNWWSQYSNRVVGPMELLQFLLTGSAVPGCVVMVSSTRGFVGGTDTGAYSAACAAQIALMLGYAREYPAVRFNALCPGLTDTDMGKEVIATGGAKADAVPQPASAVAQAIVDLVESDATGKVMRVVDGVATEAKWSW